MDALFKEGVSYFSRVEEVQARAIESAKRDRNNGPMIHLRTNDTTSINFIERVQHDIEVWRSQGMVRFMTSIPEEILTESHVSQEASLILLPLIIALGLGFAGWMDFRNVSFTSSYTVTFRILFPFQSTTSSNCCRMTKLERKLCKAEKIFILNRTLQVK